MGHINPQTWHWTPEKWADSIPPANINDIINIANRIIDDFIESGTNITSEDLTIFCNDLWTEYCLCRWASHDPPIRQFKKDDYARLLERALLPDAQQIDIDTLGEWLECWGDTDSWDGKCYHLGNRQYLYPIYSRWPDRYGTYSLLRYDICLDMNDQI